MKKEHLAVISERLGVEPVFINSALVSAQNRQRYYWANWYFGQPVDLGIKLSEVLHIEEHRFDIYQKDNPKKPRPSKEKSSCLTGTANAAGNHSQMDVVVIRGYKIPLTTTGRIDIHSSPFVFRYTVEDCERLQTVPVGYTSSVSNSQAYKMLINGWTVDVIAHIFKHGLL